MQSTKKPYKGIPDTIAHMRHLADNGQSDPVVRGWAEKLVANLEPNNTLSECAAIFYDVAKNIRYTKDPRNAELIRHPAQTLAAMQGDCDDMAILARAGVGAGAQSIGAVVEYLTVGFTRDRGHSHVLLRVKDAQTGNWIVLDPVAGPKTDQMLKTVKSWKAYD